MRKKRSAREMEPVFVASVPRTLEEGKLYIATRFRTVTHKCACGCGTEVNTPLHPTGWAITFDGVSISLWPSVGNWGEACQSHYWIEKSRVFWARQWTRDQIQRGRRERRKEIEKYYRRIDDKHEKGTQWKGRDRRIKRLWLSLKTRLINRFSRKR